MQQALEIFTKFGVTHIGAWLGTHELSPTRWGKGGIWRQVGVAAATQGTWVKGRFVDPAAKTVGTAVRSRGKEVAARLSYAGVAIFSASLALLCWFRERRDYRQVCATMYYPPQHRAPAFASQVAGSNCIDTPRRLGVRCRRCSGR